MPKKTTLARAAKDKREAEDSQERETRVPGGTQSR